MTYVHVFAIPSEPLVFFPGALSVALLFVLMIVLAVLAELSFGLALQWWQKRSRNRVRATAPQLEPNTR